MNRLKNSRSTERESELYHKSRQLRCLANFNSQAWVTYRPRGRQNGGETGSLSEMDIANISLIFFSHANQAEERKIIKAFRHCWRHWLETDTNSRKADCHSSPPVACGPIKGSEDQWSSRFSHFWNAYLKHIDLLSTPGSRYKFPKL